MFKIELIRIVLTEISGQCPVIFLTNYFKYYSGSIPFAFCIACALLGFSELCSSSGVSHTTGPTVRVVSRVARCVDR